MPKSIEYLLWLFLGANIGSFIMNGLIALLGANLPYSALVALFSFACSVMLAVVIAQTAKQP